MSEGKSGANVNFVEQRSDSRIRVSAPIEVIQTDREGRAVTEQSCIEDVSDFGCRFSIRGAVERGDLVTVNLLGADHKPLRNEPPRRFEVMWVQRDAKLSIVGARVLEGQKLDKVKLAEESWKDPQHPESLERKDS